MREKKRFLQSIFYTCAGAVLVIGIWYLLSSAYSDTVVPRPDKTGAELLHMLRNPVILYNISATLIRSFTAFVTALLLGSIIGILSGISARFRNIFFIPSLLLQGAPPLLWVVPIIIIAGTGDLPVMIISTLIVLPIVIINVTEGVKAVDSRYFAMFAIYAPSRRLILNHLIVPSLYPYYRGIIILGFVLAMKSSIVAEWFGSRNGLGKIINSYFYSFQMRSFYALSILFLIIVIGTGIILQRITAPFLARKQSVIPPETPETPVDTHLNSTPESLHIDQIEFRYGKRELFHHLSLHVTCAETVLLTGRSGAGKTTIARIAAGLTRVQSGEISLPSRPCILFQDDLLLEHLDLYGNVILPCKARDLSNAHQITMDAIRICGLDHYLHYFPDQLSGGMKKRAAFARALALDPNFIILDEPFNNLDSNARKELWDLFFSLFTARGISSIIITHYPEELADRRVTHYQLEGGILKKTETHST